MDTLGKIRAEIERLIEMNKTKRGFPAGTICAVRIEAYEKLLSFLDSLEDDRDTIFWKGMQYAYDQLMKEAVDGTVHHYSSLAHYVKTDEVRLIERLKQFQDGDKVKVIIVRSDETSVGRKEQG